MGLPGAGGRRGRGAGLWRRPGLSFTATTLLLPLLTHRLLQSRGFPLPLSSVIIFQNNSELRKALPHRFRSRTSPQEKTHRETSARALGAEHPVPRVEGPSWRFHDQAGQLPRPSVSRVFPGGRWPGCLNLGPQQPWSSQKPDLPEGQAHCKAQSSRHRADLSVLTVAIAEPLPLCRDLARSPGHFATPSVCRLCVHLSHNSVALSSLSRWPPDPAGVSWLFPRIKCSSFLSFLFRKCLFVAPCQSASALIAIKRSRTAAMNFRGAGSPSAPLSSRG